MEKITDDKSRLVKATNSGDSMAAGRFGKNSKENKGWKVKNAL